MEFTNKVFLRPTQLIIVKLCAVATLYDANSSEMITTTIIFYITI